MKLATQSKVTYRPSSKLVYPDGTRWYSVRCFGGQVAARRCSEDAIQAYCASLQREIDDRARVRADLEEIGRLIADDATRYGSCPREYRGQS